MPLTLLMVIIVDNTMKISILQEDPNLDRIAIMGFGVTNSIKIHDWTMHKELNHMQPKKDEESKININTFWQEF